MFFLIKQIPDDYSEASGLSKYNRSRMPGCKDSFQASQNFDGTYTTGLSEEVSKTYTERLKRDFSPTSEFWTEFMVTIDADKPRIFNTALPMDDISLKMLIANKHVAPDREAINNPEYREAQYYAYTEEEEDTKELNTRKRKAKANALLLDMSDNKEKMLLFGQYLEGVKYSVKFKEDTLYKMLSSFIDSSIENTTLFLSVFDKSVEELQQKIIIDRALKARLINKVGTGNKKTVYQFGQVTLGNTIEEVYKNLSSPDFAPELVALKNELDNR